MGFSLFGELSGSFGKREEEMTAITLVGLAQKKLGEGIELRPTADLRQDLLTLAGFIDDGNAKGLPVMLLELAEVAMEFINAELAWRKRPVLRLVP